MRKRVGKIKGFFGEFKAFITRGNVLDMAVGVIVGGAFTAIVNGLSNFILKPLINWLLAELIGADGLAGTITMLSPAYMTDEAGAQVIDLANSIYIDWGSFINAIINFLLIAFTLFIIVRTINNIAKAREQAKLEIAEGVSEKKAIKKIKKEQKVSKKVAKKIYEDKVEAAKAAIAAAEAEAAAKAAEEAAAAKAAEEEKAMANTRLLEQIRDLLKNK